jgi:hypothetical protein
MGPCLSIGISESDCEPSGAAQIQYLLSAQPKPEAGQGIDAAKQHRASTLDGKDTDSTITPPLTSVRRGALTPYRHEVSIPVRR